MNTIPNRLRAPIILLFTLALLVLLVPQTVAAAPPSNDNFADRRVINADHFLWQIYCNGATTEPGDPNPAGPNGFVDRSVWWGWTAPADGFVRLGLGWVEWQGSGSPVIAAVYAGDTLEQLTLVARVTDFLSGMADIPVRGGVHYALMGATLGASGNLSVKMDFWFHALPANDNFAQRLALTGTEVGFAVSTFGATREPGEPDTGPSGSVWWTWTAPADGVASLWIQGSFGVRVAAFQGDQLATLRKVSQFDQSEQDFFDAKAGETYQIVVTGPPDTFVGWLVLSQMRIVSPPDGMGYPGPTDILLRLVNVPDVRLTRAWLGSELIPLTADRRLPAEIWLTNLSAGTHELALVIVDEEPRSFMTPAVRFTIQPAANNLFADRPALTGDNVTVLVDLRGATSKPGEPDTSPSLWWTWTPSQDGWLRLSASRSVAAAYELYTGDSLAALVPVPWTFVGEETREFPVQRGVNYQLRIAGFGPPHEVQLCPVTTPENDAFAARKLLAGDAASDDALIGKATVEPGEPALFLNDRTATLWYSWTAPGRGRLEVSGVALGPSSLFLGVYTGDTLAALQPLASPVTGPLMVQAGQTLPIVVASRNDGVTRSHLELRFTPAPAEDDFARAGILTGTSGSVPLDLAVATSESAEPLPAPASRTVWYRWTAPATGVLQYDLRLQTNTFLPPPALAVYVGDTLDQLQRVFYSRDDEWGNLGQGPVGFAVTNDVTYSIQVLVQEGQAEVVDLAYRFFPRPLNDGFSNRITLAGDHLRWQGDHVAATPEPGEESLVGFAGRSVWWEWTAPRSAWARLALASNASLAYIASFSIDQNSQPVPLSIAFSDGVTVWFRAEAGQHYALLLDWPPPFLDPWWLESLRFRLSEVELSLDLTTLEASAPATGAVFKEPEQPIIRVQPPDPLVDGVITNLSLAVLAQDFRLPNAAYSTTFAVAGMVPPLEMPLSDLAAGFYVLTLSARNAAGEELIGRPASFILRPANDDFATPTILEGRSAHSAGTTLAATREPGEPAAINGEASIWYRWRAPSDGSLQVSTSSGSLSLFTGSALTSLEVVNPLPETPWLYEVHRDVTYTIVVAGDTHPPGPLDLYLQLTTLFLSQIPNIIIQPGTAVPVRLTCTEPPGKILRLELWEDEELIGSAPGRAAEFAWVPRTGGGRWLRGVVLLEGGENLGPVYGLAQVAAPNGWFASRTQITGSSVILSGDFNYANATAEGPVAGLHLWFTWRASATGRLLLKPSTLQTGIRISRGDSLPSLVDVTQLAGGDDRSAQVERDGVYQIALSAGALGGSYRVELELQAPPGNDNFEDAIGLSGYPLTVAASLRWSTVQPGEPLHDATPAPCSAWWRWTAPQEGILELTVAATQAQCRFGVYNGDTLQGLVPVPKLTGEDLNESTSPTYRLRGGETVRIALAAPYLWAGPMDWTLDFVPPPPNDDFASALQLDGLEWSVFASLRLASREPGDPVIPGPLGANAQTLWYTWTAPTTDWALVELVSNRYLALAVYGGDEPGWLWPVTLLDWYGGRRAFLAEAGMTYRILVAGPRTPEPFHLNFRLGFPPLRITPVHQDANLRLLIDGLYGRGAVLETSKDLVDWTPIASVPMGDLGQLDWAYDRAESGRFFRLSTFPP